MMNKAIAIVLLFCSSVSVAQEVSNVTASFDNVNGAVNVSYDLFGQGKSRYKVELLCSVDCGQTFTDALVGVTGNVGYNVRPGIKNQISWAYFVDLPDFTGTNVVMKVVAKKDVEFKENLILSRGGPEKFYQSVLLPGYGNYHVRNGKGYTVITGAVFAILGAAVYFNYQSKNSYSDYQNSTSVEGASLHFEKAQKFSNISNGLLIGGASIWTIDIAQVIVTGMRNRKLQRQILQRRQK